MADLAEAARAVLEMAWQATLPDYQGRAMHALWDARCDELRAALVQHDAGMRQAGMAESVKHALMLDPGEYDALFRAMSAKLVDEVEGVNHD